MNRYENKVSITHPLGVEAVRKEVVVEKPGPDQKTSSNKNSIRFDKLPPFLPWGTVWDSH